MGHRLGLVGAALMSGASIATAVPSLSIGPGTEIVLSGSATVRYDDNVLLAPAAAESDTIFVLTPGIALEYSEGPSKGAISLSEQFLRYSDNSSLDGDLAALIGNYRYAGPKSEFDLGASYRQLSQNSIRIRSADQKEKRDLTAFNIGGQTALTAKTRLAVSADFLQTDYENAGFIDSKVWSLPVDLYLERSEKLDLSVGYRYRQSTLSGSLPDSKDHFFNIGARGDVTAKLGGQVRVGFNRRNFSNGTSEDQLGLGASLTYSLSPKSNFDLGVSNDFNSSATGDSQRVFAVSAVGRFDLTPKLTGVIGLSFDSSEYIASSRKDDFWVAESSVQYALNNNWAVQGEYVFRSNDSSVNGLGFDNNVLSFSLSCRY